MHGAWSELSRSERYAPGRFFGSTRSGESCSPAARSLRSARSAPLSSLLPCAQRSSIAHCYWASALPPPAARKHPCLCFSAGRRRARDVCKYRRHLFNEPSSTPRPRTRGPRSFFRRAAPAGSGSVAHAHFAVVSNLGPAGRETGKLRAHGCRGGPCRCPGPKGESLICIATSTFPDHRRRHGSHAPLVTRQANTRRELLTGLTQFIIRWMNRQ